MARSSKRKKKQKIVCVGYEGYRGDGLWMDLVSESPSNSTTCRDRLGLVYLVMNVNSNRWCLFKERGL